MSSARRTTEKLRKMWAGSPPARAEGGCSPRRAEAPRGRPAALHSAGAWTHACQRRPLRPRRARTRKHVPPTAEATLLEFPRVGATLPPGPVSSETSEPAPGSRAGSVWPPILPPAGWKPTWLGSESPHDPPRPPRNMSLMTTFIHSFSHSRNAYQAPTMWQY